MLLKNYLDLEAQIKHLLPSQIVGFKLQTVNFSFLDFSSNFKIA